MKAGRLRFLVDIERPSATTDAAGGEVVSFSRHAVAWADIQPLKGRERAASEQIVAEVDTRITMRWSESLKEIGAKWRVVHEGVVYDIKYVGHLGLRRRELELMCVSGVNEG